MTETLITEWTSYTRIIVGKLQHELDNYMKVVGLKRGEEATWLGLYGQYTPNWCFAELRRLYPLHVDFMAEAAKKKYREDSLVMLHSDIMGPQLKAQYTNETRICIFIGLLINDLKIVWLDGSSDDWYNRKGNWLKKPDKIEPSIFGVKKC